MCGENVQKGTCESGAVQISTEQLGEKYSMSHTEKQSFFFLYGIMLERQMYRRQNISLPKGLSVKT